MCSILLHDWYGFGKDWKLLQLDLYLVAIDDGHPLVYVYHGRNV